MTITGRNLIAAWIATLVVLVIGLGWVVREWVSLGTLGTTAGAQHARLSREVDAQRQAIQAELVGNADLLRDIRWSPAGASPDAVVRRLAELARGGQTKVSAIAPLERESTARYRKSWHRVEMAAPFRDLVDFASKVEQEGGILEEVVLETGPGDVRAQFRLSAMEPSPEAKAILGKATAASRASNARSQVSALTLPMDDRAAAARPALRDPFAFVVRAPAKAGGPVVAAAPVALKGIVKFPGGAVAIVNDQVVKVGDVVDGHRITEISDGRVVLKQADGGSQAVILPGIANVPAGPKRQ
jgi:hypothetical protein